MADSVIGTALAREAALRVPVAHAARAQAGDLVDRYRAQIRTY